MRDADAARIRGAVVDLALGDAATAERGQLALETGGAHDWTIAISLAAAWGIVHPLRRHLDESRLPAEVAARMRDTSLALAARSTYIVHRSVRALELLQRAEIAAVAIKGVGLIAALRRPPGTRATGDLDLIVEERDATRARHALMAAGFAEINPAFALHMEEIAQSSQLHNYARALRHDDFEVDLHWRMGPHPPPALAADRLIAHALTAQVAGHTIAVADPVDGVLINAHHALRGTFDPHNTIRDCCDLRLWWDAGPIADRLEETIAAALENALAPALLALWNTILRRDPAHPLRTGAARLHALLSTEARTDAALLEQLIEAHIRHGNSARFTLDLFQPRRSARASFGRIARALTGRRRAAEATAAPDAYRAIVRPLHVRIAAAPARAWRVLREIGRARALRTYGAVARAQRRFHER
jgi:hypothetical protein